MGKLTNGQPNPSLKNIGRLNDGEIGCYSEARVVTVDEKSIWTLGIGKRGASYIGGSNPPARLKVWRKMKFKVGDRVAVYDYNGRTTGTVVSVPNPGLLLVEQREQQQNTRNYRHPKQCRRLVKKERRRVWVRLKPDGSVYEASQSPDPVQPFSFQWIEFIEVKKKCIHS